MLLIALLSGVRNLLFCASFTYVLASSAHLYMPQLFTRCLSNIACVTLMYIVCALTAKVLQQSYVTQQHSWSNYSFIFPMCFHLLCFPLTIGSLLCDGCQYCFCLINESYEKNKINNMVHHQPYMTQCHSLITLITCSLTIIFLIAR